MAKSQNEEIHSSYRSTNLVKVIKYGRLRWVGHEYKMEGFFQNVNSKLTCKKRLGRSRLRWEDSNVIDLE